MILKPCGTRWRCCAVSICEPSATALPGDASKAKDSEGLARLENFLGGLERLLPSWSDNLSSRYFSHARTLPISIGL